MADGVRVTYLTEHPGPRITRAAIRAAANTLEVIAKLAEGR